MKAQIITLVTAEACMFFAPAQAAAGTAMHNFGLFITTAATTTTTTTTVTTTTDGNTVRETRTTTRETVASNEAVSPEIGGYTYVEYNGVKVPYYKGYYYIGGVWV